MYLLIGIIIQNVCIILLCIALHKTSKVNKNLEDTLDIMSDLAVEGSELANRLKNDGLLEKYLDHRSKLYLYSQMGELFEEIRKEDE